MAIGRGFRRLADLIESIEATDVEITDVTVPDEKPDRGLLADIRLRVPLDGGNNVSTVEADHATTSVGSTADEALNGTTDEATNGTTHNGRDDAGDATPEGIDGEPVSPDADGDEETTSTDADGDDRDRSDETAETAETDRADETDEGDGDREQVVCRAGGCDQVFDTEHGMKIHHTKTHGLSTDDEAPAYRDPDALREVYAEHDSFTEMTEALGVDVAPQTVRRNMIKHGIHDPDATDDETDAPARPESDVDLPDGTTLDDVKAAVASADTLYEVQQALDLEREQATDLLRELGLLELVHGRVATKHRRDDLKDEIDERLRKSATSD